MTKWFPFIFGALTGGIIMLFVLVVLMKLGGKDR